MSGVRRSRWAAIGAAVAVTLGGGGLFVATAASSPASSVVTIDPVRILDTRSNVGLSGPFASLTPRKLQVTGSAVPAGATGVLLNVTVVSASADGFLSVRPGDATGAPSTSSLNFEAGDIVPNAVQVGMPTSGANAGQIDIAYNAFGQLGPTTDVLVDVVGYMVAGGAGTGPAGPTDPALLARIDALEAANTALNAEITALKANIATNTTNIATLDAAQPFAVTNRDNFTSVDSTGSAVVSVTVTAQVAGQVTVNSTTQAEESAVGDSVFCSITTSTASTDSNYLQRWESSGANTGSRSQLAGTRTFDIAEGATATYNLFCRHAGTSAPAVVSDSVLTAIFTPAP
jgi:hypothetical protein